MCEHTILELYQREGKDYFYIADVDDRDYLSLLVRETYKILPEPKAVIKREKKRS